MARGNGAGRPDDLLEEVELPARTRLGGGGDRRLLGALALVLGTLALAVLKPWSWDPSVPASPAASRAASAPAAEARSPTASPAATARSRPWTELTDRVSCLSTRIWMLVVDEVDAGGRTISRTWSRVDVVAADGPLDPAIPVAHAYADAIPRIGICARTAGRFALAPDEPIEVRAWQVRPGRGPRGLVAVPIEPRLVSGGRVADGGVLLGPPDGLKAAPLPVDPGDDRVGPADRGGFVPDGRPDPAAPPSAGGDRVGRPWPVGRYVLRVRLAGTGPGGTDAAWLAVEVRGPWTGHAEADYSRRDP